MTITPYVILILYSMAFGISIATIDSKKSAKGQLFVIIAQVILIIVACGDIWWWGK